MTEIKRAHQWAVKRSEQGKRHVCIVCGAIKAPNVKAVCWVEDVPEPVILTGDE